MTSPGSKDQFDLRAQALAYARRGWPVFPIRPRDKRPLTDNGFKDAVNLPNSTHGRAAVDQVTAWWSQWPAANIGIATGVIFDVLDLDGIPGKRALIEHFASIGIEHYIHNGPLSNTGKGVHLLFAATGAGNRAKMLDAPIDYRGSGGYIVAPPSVHPLGHRYTWDERRGPNHELPDAPEWLQAMLEYRKRNTAVEPLRIERLSAPEKLAREVITKTGALRGARPDIFEVVKQLGLDVVPHGRYYATTCIFHDDNNPSMVLYEHDNSFCCFSCNAVGDSFNLQDGRDAHGKRAITRP